MNFEDERYVRLYIRDTINWLSLSFEAQGLLSCILRKMSRAGIIELGSHGKRGVAVIIGHPHRWETLRPALEELLTDGVLTIRKNCLIAPKFQQAQEATQSDAARQRARRERIRDELMAAQLLGDEFRLEGEPEPQLTEGSGPRLLEAGPDPEPPEPVTKRDEASRDLTPSVDRVTKRDEMSRGPVVASRAVTPSQPSLPNQPSEPIQPKDSSSSFKIKDEEEDPAVRELRGIWNSHKAPEMPLWNETPKARRRAAKARLKERSDFAEWVAIVQRLAQSKFARGLVPGSNGSCWIADADFLLRPDTGTKVLEGKYDERRPRAASQPPPLLPEQPDNPAGRAWGGLLKSLEKQGKSYALTWLRRLKPLCIEGGVLHLEAPDRYFIDWVDEHYLEFLEGALSPLQLHFQVQEELAAQA